MGVRSLLAVCLLVLVGCGGGGDDGPQEFTVVLKPVASLSGGVDSAGGLSVTPGIVLGDDPTPTTYRIVQSFSVAGIPDGSVVISAIYRNEQVEVVGEPYATLGLVRMISTDLGAALGPEDYTPPGISLLHGTLSDSAALGVRTVDISDFVQNLVTADVTERFDIMLEFSTPDDGDGAFDQAVFYGPPRSGDLPGIVVRYRQ